MKLLKSQELNEQLLTLSISELDILMKLAKAEKRHAEEELTAVMFNDFGLVEVEDIQYTKEQLIEASEFYGDIMITIETELFRRFHSLFVPDVKKEKQQEQA